MALAAGARLGSYEILGPLGRGGMGEVYRARDARLGRDVAVKVLPPAFTRDPERLARFEREARLLASLNHPHIAAIYDVQESAGVHALILELVPGDTLADRLAGPVDSGAPATREALAFARQIADALEAAHERGVIHRDLKPSNIKITPAGVAKVLDFGLAKADADAAADLTHSPTALDATADGVLLGTAAYMSPEQARGKPVDKRADIWAFGCVLYEMLTRRRAFPGDTTSDIIAAVLVREPDWAALPQATPAAVHRLLARCLEKDPRRRLRDIGDARLEIEDALNEPAPSDDRPRPRRTSRALAWTAIAASAIAIALVAWDRMGAPRTSPAPQTLGPRFSRLTWDTSFATQPALAPDGTLVVYASDRGAAGQLDLWLQRVGGGPPIQLTNDPSDDGEPAFSPDGSVIAFRSDRNGGGIYVMPALGGNPRFIAERGRQPRFSPDGNRIAYWTGPWLGGPRTPGSAIFIVPATGGSPVRVAPSFTTALSPVWSPDGRRLLFFGEERRPPGAEFDWWIAPLEGGEPQPTGMYRLLNANRLYGTTVNNLVAPAPDALPSAWVPDGVLFSARRDESVNLWRVKIADGSASVMDASLERLTSGPGSDVLASADRAGRIAFEMESAIRSSLTLPLNANAGVPVGPVVPQASDASLFDGRSSVDFAGRLLAYPKVRATHTELWVKDLTNGQDRHVLTTPLSQLNPIISLDGTKVAYAVPEGGNVAGYVVPVDGGTARRICEACNLGGWLADNRRILALSLGAGSVNPGRAPGRVRVVDVIDGTTRDAIVDPSAGIGRADASPDGRWLAFAGRDRMWIAPLRPGTPPGDQEWTLVRSVRASSAERPCGWSPDSRLLYLLLEEDGFRDLYAQRIDANRGVPVGDPFVVQHLHDPHRRWGSTPYGTAIVRNAFVFNQTDLTGSIWLLDSTR